MSDLHTLAEGLRILRAPVELPSGITRAPTAKQIRAVENLVGNGGNKTEAMREAGYGEGTINTPGKVFDSAVIQALMKKNKLSEDDLFPVLREKVDSTKEHIQIQALDMSFNILGSYAPKRTESKNDHRIGIFSMKDLRKKMETAGLTVVGKTE